MSEYAREERRLKFANLRLLRRSNLQDNARHVDPASVSHPVTSHQDFQKLCKLLSKKSEVTPSLLSSIKSALLKGTDYINVFMQMDSALMNLLRFFYVPSVDSELQLLAGHCLCNLALGDSKECEKLAKVAGPYLVLKMEAMNPHLAESCAWTIGNLSSHIEVVSMLREQGAYTHVLKLLESFKDGPVRDTALYAITLAVHHALPVFSDEECLQFTDICLSEGLKENQLLFLLSMLSCRPEVMQSIIKFNIHVDAVPQIKQALSIVTEEPVRVLSLIRLLGNVVTEESGVAAFAILDLPILSAIVPELLNHQNPAIGKETLWLLANLTCHKSTPVRDKCEHIGLTSLVSNLP